MTHAVKEHGVSEELIQAMFAQNRAFFALPEAQKMKIKANKDFRGYTPMKVGIFAYLQQLTCTRLGSYHQEEVYMTG